MKQKTLALFLSVVMSVACLAGCGNTTQEETSSAVEKTTDSSSSESKVEDTEKVEAPRKLTILSTQQPTITDYEDNSLTKRIEEELNMDIEFQLIPQEEAGSKLALMLSSGEKLPDVIFDQALLDASVAAEYGSLGKFLALDEYYQDPEAMPNLWSLDEEARELMTNSAKSADGHIYAMTSYFDHAWNMTPHRMWINRTWLDNLGLDMPTTTDELKEVLIAFRDNDPNQNGEKDEIPFVGKIGGYGSHSIGVIMNAFEFWNCQMQNNGLALSEDKTTVIAPFEREGWREGLTYMHELYEEGLYSSDSFTVDDTQWKALLNNEDAAIVGLTVSGGISSWPDAVNNVRFQDMELMEPLAGPEGVCYSPAMSPAPYPIYAITSDCENVDLAVEFGDLFYSFTYSVSARYGEEGVDWSSDPEDLEGQTGPYVEAGMCEGPAVVLINDIWTQNTNHLWKIQHMYYPAERVGGTVNLNYDPNDPNNLQQVLFGEHYQLYHLDKIPDHLLPVLVYTDEEMDELSDTMATVSTYVSTSMVDFITGMRDIESDSDWENYLKELEKMGLPRWLEVAQEAYDRR